MAIHHEIVEFIRAEVAKAVAEALEQKAAPDADKEPADKKKGKG